MDWRIDPLKMDFLRIIEDHTKIMNRQTNVDIDKSSIQKGKTRQAWFHLFSIAMIKGGLFF